MNKFLIIGAGLSGCSAGYELAEMGHEVEIVDSSDQIGGKVLDYCCKATNECSKCGVCTAHSTLGQALRHPNIQFTQAAQVESVSTQETGMRVSITYQNPTIDHKRCIDCGACLEACPHDCFSRYARAELIQYGVNHSRCVLRDGTLCNACADACPTHAIVCEDGSAEQEREVRADAALIATGHDPYDATQKVRYGYGRFENVITGVEAESMLSKQTYLGDPDESIAFIQCVGSRDPQIQRNYCSGVCCAYALRIARMIKHRSPRTDVAVYYIDIQNFDKTFALFREELAGSGIRFIRGVPFKVEQSSDNKLKLLMESQDGDNSVALHDTVVLSVGLGPAAGSKKVAELFGLDGDENGFLTGRSPVFVSGTCREPQSIPDSIAQARATALEMSKVVWKTL